VRGQRVVVVNNNNNNNNQRHHNNNSICISPMRRTAAASEALSTMTSVNNLLQVISRQVVLLGLEIATSESLVRDLTTTPPSTEPLVYGRTFL